MCNYLLLPSHTIHFDLSKSFLWMFEVEQTGFKCGFTIYQDTDYYLYNSSNYNENTTELEGNTLAFLQIKTCSVDN